MGSLKLEQQGKVEQAEQRGAEIRETGDQKVEEAETSAAALEGVEAIDDDDKAAVDAARSEADGIAKAIAESDVRAPGQEVGESLQETASESREYSDIEMQDAEKAGEMTGDYSDTGSNLAGQLEASGEEFAEIADQSDEVNDEMQAEVSRIAAALEGTF